MSAEWKMMTLQEVVVAVRSTIDKANHAMQCLLMDQRRSHRHPADAPEKGQCTWPGCSEAKTLFSHVIQCQLLNCTVHDCCLLRFAVAHRKSCNAVNCPICSNLKCNPSASATMRAVVIPPAASLTTVASAAPSLPFVPKQPVTSVSVSEPVNVAAATVQRKASSFLAAAAAATSSAPLSGSAEKQPGNWRESVREDSRTGFIYRLIDALTANCNIIGGVNQLISYAQKMECHFFTIATSQHNYHCLIADKIAAIVKGTETIEFPSSDDDCTSVATDSSRGCDMAPNPASEANPLAANAAQTGLSIGTTPCGGASPSSNVSTTNSVVADQSSRQNAVQATTCLKRTDDGNSDELSPIKKPRLDDCSTPMTTPKTGDGGKVTPSASLSSSSFGLSPSINVTTKTAAPSTAVAETAAVAGVLRVSYYALPRAMLCIGFVTRGHCPRGASCMYHHSANGKPYQWQWQRTNTESTDSSVPTTRPPAGNGVAPWIDFGRKANNVLEWTFSDESKSDCNVTDEGNESDKGGVDVDGRQLRFKVDFDRMKFTDGETCGRVRRLEVESSGVDGFSNSDASTADVPDRNLRRYATVWRWFWLDKRTWKPYESNQPKDVAVVTSVSRQDQQQKQFCSTTTGYISSETIELAYRCNPDGRITFVASISGTSYIIDFSERVQVNQETGFCRKMRRRPAPWPSTSSVLADSLLNTAEAIFKPSVQFPATWDLSLVAGDSRYQLINVTDDGPTADEYDEVAQLFYSSMNTSIKSIQRIQNLSLWEKFCQFRTDAARRRRQPVDVRRLFHGTKEKYIEAIFSNGFDWRLFGKSSGTVYGKGSYFARDAVYSSEYTDCNKMFLVQVAVGDYTQGRRTFARPPPKDSHQPYDNLYDSCVDDPVNPSIFVTFDHCQSYPEYIIEY